MGLSLYQNAKLNLRMRIVNKLKKTPRLLFVILAFVFCLNLYLATRDSQTIDEGAHLAAGYSYVTTGDFRLNPEHPALFKLLAGAAILPLDTKPAEQLRGWENGGNQWPAGKDLIYNSRSSARQILLVARIPSILITITLIYAVFLLARRMASEKVALLASGLLALDPTLIGHGHLVTNDIFLGLGAVAFLLGALNYWAKPNKKHLLLFALAALLIISAKFSGLLLVPLAAIIIGIKQWRHKKQLLKHLLATFAILFFGIWLQYGFQAHSFSQELSQTPPSDPLVEGAANFKNKHPGLSWVYSLPVPAYAYGRGLVNLIHHNQWGHDTYLYGSRNTLGSPLFFPVGMAIKLPEVIIAANLAAVWLIIFKYRREKSLLILLGFASIFVATSITSHINIGIRHVFGAWPFIYITAAIVLARVLKGKQKHLLVVFAVLLYIPVLVGAFRIPIGYQNMVGETLENVGDKPVLVDSNRDWAQDLYRLNDYLNDHKITRFGEGLFNNTDMTDVFGGKLDAFGDKKICTLKNFTPECNDGSPLPCYLFISDTAYWLNKAEFYRWVLEVPGMYDLVGRIGGSISIYQCSLEVSQSTP